MAKIELSPEARAYRNAYKRRYYQTHKEQAALYQARWLEKKGRELAAAAAQKPETAPNQ